MNKAKEIELLKRIRHIRGLLDGFCNAHTGLDNEVYDAAEAMGELENFVADQDTPPKTIGEALQRFQEQHQDNHLAEQELLSALQSIDRNV